MDDIKEENIIDKHLIALKWVKDSKQLVLNPWNHFGVVENDCFIPTLIYLTAEQEDDVIRTALEIGYLLIQNPKIYPTLRHNAVFVEGYKFAYQTYRNSKQHRHWTALARDVLQKLKDSKYEIVPKEDLQLQDQEDKEIWGDTSVSFFLPKLSPMNRDSVASLLAKVPGVVSCNVRVTWKMATVTVRSGFSPLLLRKTVAARLLLDIRTIHPSTNIADLLQEDSSDGEKMPPYLPEIDSPVKDSAISAKVVGNLKDQATGLIGWFQKSFYW